MTCNGTNSVTHSPALTNTSQTTTVTAQSTFPTCASATNPSIRSGTIVNGTITKPESCTSLLGSFSVTNLITWNTGQTSTLSFNGSTEEVDGQFVIVLTGSVTAGLFTGALVTEQTTLLADVSACAGAGISANSGPSVLTVLGL